MCPREPVFDAVGLRCARRCARMRRHPRTAMIPNRRQRLKELFPEAVALPPEERVRVVAEAADVDAALGRELESLLASYERADGFLERPPEISPLKAPGYG